MARPAKKGIDYFPFDVNVFEDDKIFDVQNEFGPLGEVVYFRLLCMIYRNGYYLRFDSYEKLASIVVRSIGFRWADDRDVIVNIIKYLVECRLFDGELAAKNILTSKGIQERYKLATERRKNGISEYSLLDGGEVSGDDNVGFCGENPTNKSKRNKSKVNETTLSSEDGASGGACDDEQAVADLFNSVCKSLPKVSKLTNKRRRNIRRANRILDGRFEEFFRRIEASDFLSGRTGNWSGSSFDWILQQDNITKILEGNYDNRVRDTTQGQYSDIYTQYLSEVDGFSI